MLKYIRFLLSEKYYEIAEARIDEIHRKISGHQIEVLLQRENNGLLKGCQDYRQETLVVTDIPRVLRSLSGDGWFVAFLFHEGNRGLALPQVKYAVEDLFELEPRSYEEIYRRLAGYPWDILETERLRVRESTLADVDEFYRIYEEPSITLYMEDLYEDRAAETAYMKAYIEQIYGFYGYGMWTVLLKESDQVIGRAGISMREGYDLPELGFVIGKDYQRRGYGFEVCREILRYAGQELGFNRVQALVREGNLVSRRLLEKLGFGFEKNVMEGGSAYRLYEASCIQ